MTSQTSTPTQRHFCVAMGLETLSAAARQALAGQRAAVVNQFAWPRGATIRVGFLEGDPFLQERVKNVAQEWTAPGLANLHLLFVTEGQMDVRIAFQQGNGSWSYIGTVCRQVNPASPTMNFGWFAADTPEDELRRVTLHEMGHALGLIHEHQNPFRSIDWNRDAVIRDLSGPPNSWDLPTIEENMFKHYDPAAVTATETDPLSIMMYPVPAAWTNDGFSVGLNSELSAMDKVLIHHVYP